MPTQSITTTPERRSQINLKDPVDLEKIRAQFPILDQIVNKRQLIYFDNAATTQKPLPVLEAIQSYYQRDNSNVHRGIHTLSQRATEGYEGARARTAQYLGVTAKEIIFTRGTTEAVNLVASTWGLDNVGPGDRILLTEMEHHSNLVPWQLLARRTGAELVYVPVLNDLGELDTSFLESALASGSVKIFSFTLISNTLGVVNPAQEWCTLARKNGVVSFVDAAQACGHRPLNAQEIGCDFLAISGHKMAGPTGIGALFGRAELLEAMSPYQGGGEMISEVTFQESFWNVIPHKFEAGTPNIAGAIGLAAAMDYLDEIGRTQIAEHDTELAAYAYDRLKGIEDIRILGPKTGRAGVVSFSIKGAPTQDLIMLADQRGIALRGGHHCNQPLMRKLGLEGTARASFYLYNTTEEIDRMLTELTDIVSFLRS
jgi:cysteine desulfurase/selenocysteine lyase